MLTATVHAAGFRKPDKEAYARAAKTLNVPPSSCLFVDDRYQFVEVPPISVLSHMKSWNHFLDAGRDVGNACGTYSGTCLCDRQVNVSAAIEYGMAGIVFESVPQLERDLAAFGISIK